MEKITQRHIRTLSTILFAVLLYGVVVNNVHAEPMDTFYAYRAETKGNTSACGPDELRWEVVLKELGSMDNVTDFKALNLKIVTHQLGTEEYIFTNFDLWGGDTPVVCVHHDSSIGARLYAGGGSAYRTVYGSAWYPLDAAVRDSEIGKYLVGHLHVPRKSDSTSVLQYVAPLDTATNINPSYLSDVNTLSPLYGATGVAKWTLHVWHAETSAWYSSVLTTPGGIGRYTHPAITNLPDGYHAWQWFFAENGSVSLPERTYITQPASGFKWDNYFILDRASPVSSISHTAISNDPGGVDVAFTNLVEDVLSGLQETTIFIRDIASGLPATSATQTFDIVGGSFVGPTDQQSYSVTARLSYNTTYEYWAVTKDVAGNVITTAKSTFTTGEAPPTPLTLTFWADETMIPAGGSTNLNWTVGGADSCTSNGWNVSPNASDGTHSQGITPTTNPQTYEITCTNATETVGPLAVTITSSPPTVSLAADPTLIRTGDTTTLTWSISPDDTGVTDCTLIGGGESTSVSTSGTIESPKLYAQTTFTLSCTFSGTTISDTASVSVLSGVGEN